MNPFQWIQELIWPTSYYEDDRYLAAKKWADGFTPKDDGLGEVILKHAKSCYDDMVRVLERQDDKGHRLLTSAGTMATIILAAIGAFKLPVVWPVAVCLTLLILAMIILVRVSWPVARAGKAGIRDVTEFIGSADNPSVWLAASLHKTVTIMHLHNERVARYHATAMSLICVALACLALSLFYLSGGSPPGGGAT